MTVTTPTGLQMVLALSSAGLWTTFAIAYLVAAKPWRSPIGKVLLLTAGSVASVFLLIASSALLGDYMLKDAVRTVVYGGNILAPLSLLLILWQSQVGRRAAPASFERPERLTHHEKGTG